MHTRKRTNIVAQFNYVELINTLLHHRGLAWLYLAVWLSRHGVAHIKEVARRREGLGVRWVTVRR